MFRNHIKLAWRNLFKNRLYSFLNILGLGSGMAMAILIGLWLVDQLSVNKYNQEYGHIGLIQKNRFYNKSIFTETSNPIPLGQRLRNEFPDDFESVVVSSYGGEKSLRHGESTVVKRGLFMEPGGQSILDLKIIAGSKQDPMDPTSILISESVSKALFGNETGIGEVIRLDENLDVNVAGVFQDLPKNSTFRSVNFYGSFALYENTAWWIKNSHDDWEGNAFPIYVRLAENSDFEVVSQKIEKALFTETQDASNPALFIHPMSKWHLYPEFKDGKAVGTGLSNVCLFGAIGFLILLLATINFMNLSTARSSQRAKEIGVRKAIGSMKTQLIYQFFTETFLLVFFSLILALVMAVLLLPTFNNIAGDSLEIPWSNPAFLLSIIAFFFVCGLASGAYPALYLSSFEPIKTLKGISHGKKRESIFRKVLVTLQFGISICLIIGTILVYQQIEFGKNRSMGYEQENLIYIRKLSHDLSGKFWPMRDALLASGAVEEMAESSGPVTEMWITSSGFEWRGKNPETREDFITLGVTPEFGKTAHWKILKGRDFLREMATDEEAIILNESAAAFMGFEDPIDEIIRYKDITYKVVGLSKNLVMESPFEKVKPTVFTMRKRGGPFINIALNPAMGISEAIHKVEDVMRTFSPKGELNIKFVSEEFGLKFWREEKVAKLASSLSLMAIFISFLGIFGLSSFMAERRRKEIGIRKLLGASLTNVVSLISSEFFVLIGISCLAAFPIAFYLTKNWLSKYELQTEISLWVFAGVGITILVMTLFTVGFRTLKTALVNPVESLKSE